MAEYVLSPTLLLSGRTDYIYFDLDQWSGSAWNLTIGLFHQTFQKVAFGLSYDGLIVNVDIDDDRVPLSLDLLAQGITANLRYTPGW